MSTDSVLNEDTKSTSLPADVTDDSCIFGYIEIVPLTRDTDGACTTECDNGDCSAHIKQENLPAVKQEPQVVCCIIFLCNRISILLLLIIQNEVFFISFYEISHTTSESIMQIVDGLVDLDAAVRVGG